jgi:hypothetical protein
MKAFSATPYQALDDSLNKTWGVVIAATSFLSFFATPFGASDIKDISDPSPDQVVGVASPLAAEVSGMCRAGGGAAGEGVAKNGANVCM